MADNDKQRLPKVLKGEGPDYVSASSSEAQKSVAQPRTPPGGSSTSFVYPVRSLLANVEPASERGLSKDAESENLPPRVETGNEESLFGSRDVRGQHPPTSDVNIPFKSVAAEASDNELLKAMVGETRESDSREALLTSDRDPDEYNPRHPEPISSFGADVLSTNLSNPVLMKPRGMHPVSMPLDFSKTGIVHLPPLPSSGSERSDSSRSAGLGRPSSKYSSKYSSVMSGVNSDLARSAIQSPVPPGTSVTGSGTDSESDGQQQKQSSYAMSSSSNEELVTSRLQSVTNEHGHHVITGREGKLTRCEDEPIRAPGAVQGFGVLIALEEDDDSGNLVVRQVSENASELLGLSPEYLFSLQCFTQTLPDSQADLLWDNVQFLDDSEIDSDNEHSENPQVFLLSGWGEPNSAISEEDEEDGDSKDDSERRFWTCWCAAHRPATARPDMTRTGERNTLPPPPRAIIILEFELERDVYNPLYPPFQHEQMSTESPGSFFSAQGSINSSRSSSVGGSSTGSSAGGSGSSTATSFSFGSSAGSLTEMAEATPTAGVGVTALSVDTPETQAAQAQLNPPQPVSINPAELFLSTQQDLEGDDEWFPSSQDVFESTTSHSKPLKALERMRKINRTLGSSPNSSSRAGGSSQTARQRARERRFGSSQPGIGTMDIFAVLAQVNDQLAAAPDLESFLKVVVGVIKDLTQFHRVLIYQFDESYNGQVVAELVDWRQTHDLYKGLHFPAADIPAQARDLYRINKVRLLYNRSQTTARLVVRSRDDLDPPLDMTHSFLRAMSPFHVKYLENMGVRASMSISIVTFGALWGLISCHSYGINGMRVSFPVRQMLRLLSDSVSRNIERLSYAQRLRTRKLISTLPTDSHPTGYIVSNAEDLIGLFDADFGVLVIGEGAKILGPNEHGQEILLVAEYLRLKQFTLMQVSQSVVKDFPDLRLPSGLEIIAGLLLVPLSRGGKDFIVFLRKGQLRDVHWAGKPFKQGEDEAAFLQPRKSFKVWSETIAGRCRAWTDEQLETAGILALVYGKFIEIWRERESALKTTQLTNLLLSNASHEVRTPLNHIINYLEMALNSTLDGETRENLQMSHSASKSLLFTINDLLDLTRLESGNETSFNEPFNLHEAIADAVMLYRNEAVRRNLQFNLDVENSPKDVVGDAKKIRTVVSNLTANAVKYTEKGSVTVSCQKFQEPRGLRNSREVAVEIVVADTGCGIEAAKLESIFREFEQVESERSVATSGPGLGLGLAVVARIVEQLGGQLRVDSKPNEGSRFSFLIPFELAESGGAVSDATRPNTMLTSRSRTSSQSSEIDSLVDAISSDHMRNIGPTGKTPKTPKQTALGQQARISPTTGVYDVADSRFPIRSVKVDDFDADKSVESPRIAQFSTPTPTARISPLDSSDNKVTSEAPKTLRVLVVEDDHINRSILMKRLSMDGHEVVGTIDGQEGVDAVVKDKGFDCILMDIQMPVLNGYDAAKAIRALESKLAGASRTTTSPSSGPQGQPTSAVFGDRRSKRINGRIPIFAVSASLDERKRGEMMSYGMDGWMLKPIDFRRLRTILQGILDPHQRALDLYSPGCNWEAGGWLTRPGGSSSSDSDTSSPLQLSGTATKHSLNDAYS